MNDTRTGQEISILGLVSLRHGFYGDFDGETWGYSVGLQYRGMAGVRYDWAEVPESPGLSDLHRQGITAFFDPYRLYRAVSPGPESVASSR